VTVSRSQSRPAMPRVARASVVVGLAAATAAVLAGVAYADESGHENDTSATYVHGRSGQNGHTEAYCPGAIGTALTGHRCRQSAAPSGAATDWSASHQESSFWSAARDSGRDARPGDGAGRTGNGLHGLHNIHRGRNGANGQDGNDETGGADGADGTDRYYYHGP
jgi:hypothetical protein